MPPLVTYLASERAGKITGHTLALDWEVNVMLVPILTMAGSVDREVRTVDDLGEVMPPSLKGDML